MKEASFYKLKDGKINCLLCPKNCLISEGKTGFCRIRKNINNRLYSLTYARYSSLNLDPVEKKPLYHFYPGKLILSLGAIGCNFKCLFCQNWSISQEDAPTREISPEDVVKLALSYNNNIGISYTYNEPLIWFEFVLDTAREAQKMGLKNVLVTNGFINPEPLAELIKFIDAMNIDIKSIEEDFYKKYCSAKLSPVLETAKTCSKFCHIEITNLIIPTLNDKPNNIKELVNWVGENLGADTPLHFSRYFPQYKMDLPPTPISTLRMAKKLAEKKLKFVYLGNVWGEDESTYCPECKNLLIERSGYQVTKFNLVDNACPKCGSYVSVVY